MSSGVRWPGALEVRPFRRLYLALVLSSFGDWLGFLATTALATQLVDGFGAQSFAVGGVLAFRLLPAVLFGPVAGVFADRFDRRGLMVVTDLLRFVLFLSIPLVAVVRPGAALVWLFAATVLVETLSLFWIPAKEASVPNLVGDRLESANQLSLVAAYATAPLAALVFGVLGLAAGRTGVRAADLALYVDAATFLFAAVQVGRIREIPRRGTDRTAAAPTLAASVREGLAFARSSPVVSGVLVAMLGALAAAGVVVANGKLFATTVLGGGDAAFALLFGTVFVGLALGVAGGPRLLGDLSRRRFLGPSIVGAGCCLLFMAVVPVLALVVLAVLLLGAFAGVAYVLGLTLLGAEVADEVRGRTFGLVNSLMRIDLLLVLAVAPPVAGAIGRREVPLPGTAAELGVNGVSVTILGAGLLAVLVGLASYRTMDDRPNVPLRSDLWALVHRHDASSGHAGTFVAVEGGEGAGKSTQVARLVAWLEAQGHEVVVTREPGATAAGARVRALLLDPDSDLAPRAEALLYAADRAQHVAEVVEPALTRGAVVVTDRYVDSSLAYQGAGRALEVAEIARLSRWATGGLKPDLVLLLDVDPALGLLRAGRAGDLDRIEQESLEFHARVRQGFLDLAAADPARYLVLAADGERDALAVAVRARVGELLPGVSAGVPVA